MTIITHNAPRERQPLSGTTLVINMQKAAPAFHTHALFQIKVGPTVYLQMFYFEKSLIEVYR